MSARYPWILKRGGRWLCAATLLGLLLPAMPATASAAAAVDTQPASVDAQPATDAQPAVAMQTAVIDSFDASSPTWFVYSGPGTVSESGKDALALAYNFGTASQIQISPKSTHPDLPGLPRQVCVDVKGDGSWNVIDMQLRDETGEIFHYAIGNVATTAWSTMCVRPGIDTPAAKIGGNGDGVVDLPLSIHRLVLDKNPGGKASKGTILFDDLRVEYEAWTPLHTDATVFVPSVKQTTTLRLGLQDAASYSATLTDEAGRTRVWTGSAPGGGVVQSLAWNGTSSAGVNMTGSVRARLKITRSGVSQTVGLPYLVGLPARYEPASPGSIVGVNSFVDTLNTSKRAAAQTEAKLMESAYVRVAREEFDWNLIEPRQGWFEWAACDQAVAVLQAHNISVVGKLVYSAAWASSAPSGTAQSVVGYYPPKSDANYAAYARAVVHHYKGSVHVWEIWNEENSATFWRPAPSATAYAALLKAAYAAIKAEDPTATVLIGGLAKADTTYLAKIYAAGAWKSFDAVAIHTFVNGTPEASDAGPWIAKVKAYVNSVGSKPIWITEAGWSTYSGSGISQATQAKYLERFYMLAAKDGVAGVMWFQFQAHTSSATSVSDNYAVVNYSGTTRPAYASLSRIGAALDQGSVLGAVSNGTLRGWVVSRRGGIEQILYTLSSPTKVSISATSPSWIIAGTTSTKLTITAGRATVSLSGLPVHILSSPSITPATILVYANGTRTISAMQWPSASGGTYTFQVFNSSGKLLATLATGVAATTGIASARWSGVVAGHVVAPGTYKLVVLLTGVDHRATALAKWVTVAAG